jgi:hypothetical protein
MAKAILLEAGVGGNVIPVEVNGYKEIQDKVGGLFDVVRQQVNDDIVAVGYVHDEGLLLDLDMNWLASALFMREIRGDVVVVNGCSPSGEYDGDDYDLPSSFIDYMKTTFLMKVANTYNESVVVSTAFDYAIDNELLEQNEIDELLNLMESSGNTEDELRNLRNSMERILEIVNEHQAKRVTEELIDEIYDFLKEQK